jgi:flotillin
MVLNNNDADDTNDGFLTKALEQFLGKTDSEIRDTILNTLEGHLRAILGTLDVEEIFMDREKFASLVLETATPDLAKMGLHILSFTIKDVYDNVDYLESLGKTQTEAVKRDADVGVAEATRDSDIAVAEAERERQEKEFEANTAIANSKRAYQATQAAYDEETNKIQAEAELAYTLQAAKLQQNIRKEELEIDVVDTRRQIEVEQQEVIRKEKELIATVHRPAEANRYKVETLAEGNRTQQVLNAQAESESIRMIGAADALSIQAIGEAEAAAMAAKADAFRSYGNAAKMSMIVDALPKLAAEVAAPLARTSDIVMLSGDSNGVTGEISKLVSQLPPAVQALTGVDLTNTLRSMSSV